MSFEAEVHTGRSAVYCKPPSDARRCSWPQALCRRFHTCRCPQAANGARSLHVPDTTDISAEWSSRPDFGSLQKHPQVECAFHMIGVGEQEGTAKLLKCRGFRHFGEARGIRTQSHENAS